MEDSNCSTHEVTVPGVPQRIYLQSIFPRGQRRAVKRARAARTWRSLSVETLCGMCDKYPDTTPATIDPTAVRAKAFWIVTCTASKQRENNVHKTRVNCLHRGVRTDVC